MTELEPLWRDLKNVYPAVLSLELGRYFVAASLTSLTIWTFWHAYFHSRKIQPRFPGTRDIWREVATSLRTAFVFSLVGFLMYLGGKARWLTIYPDFSVRGWGYFFVSLLAMIVAHDAYFYWTHRAVHHPRLFRLLHTTHHKSKAPTPWTAYAFDVSEALVLVVFVPLWVAFVPMHDLGLYCFMTWQIVRNVMGHAGVEMFPNGTATSPLFSWINTTTHHDLHHQDGRYNFGLYFTWWDRLMGTEHPLYRQRFCNVTSAASATAPEAGSRTVATVGPTKRSVHSGEGWSC
jgi:sterol desaturase/sphingolipid hydroxylase (fatty acid hydroxylase superfamily)